MQKQQKGFTLIELLVVVLIIGILSAVALPQYQKAVWKSRNIQLKTLLNSVVQAQHSYYMANGVYSYRFDELGIDVPLTSTRSNSGCKISSQSSDPGRKGKNFEIFISKLGNIFAYYTEGPYKCGGFHYSMNDEKMYCTERYDSDAVGKFCKQLENATYDSTPSTWRYYNMP